MYYLGAQLHGASCAVQKTRDDCNADNDIYAPFIESKEVEERRLNTDD